MPMPNSSPDPDPVPIPIPIPIGQTLIFFWGLGALVVGSVSVSKSKLDKRRERTIMPYSIFTGLSWSVKMNLN